MRGSKLDELMTLLFLIIAAASVIVAFIFNSRTLFIYIAGAALLLRGIQYILRFIKK